MITKSKNCRKQYLSTCVFFLSSFEKQPSQCILCKEHDTELWQLTVRQQAFVCFIFLVFDTKVENGQSREIL